MQHLFHEAIKHLYVTACVLHLQPVVLLVRMEEHAVVLTLLSVTVPVGTQDPTARTEVCMNVCSYRTKNTGDGP